MISIAYPLFYLIEISCTARETHDKHSGTDPAYEEPTKNMHPIVSGEDSLAVLRVALQMDESVPAAMVKETQASVHGVARG